MHKIAIQSRMRKMALNSSKYSFRAIVFRLSLRMLVNNIKAQAQDDANIIFMLQWFASKLQ